MWDILSSDDMYTIPVFLLGQAMATNPLTLNSRCLLGSKPVRTCREMWHKSWYITVYLLTYQSYHGMSRLFVTSCWWVAPQSSQGTRPSARVSSAETQLLHIAGQEIGWKISKFLGGTSWVWSVVSGHAYMWLRCLICTFCTYLIHRCILQSNLDHTITWSVYICYHVFICSILLCASYNQRSEGDPPCLNRLPEARKALGPVETMWNYMEILHLICCG